jgi:hypothetical protein
MKGEMSAKTTYQRSAKGNISIAECDATGKFIVFENTGKKVSIRAIIIKAFAHLSDLSHDPRSFHRHFILLGQQSTAYTRH